MPPLKQVALIALVLVPVAVHVVLRHRLAAYRRDRDDVVPSFLMSNWRVLRPDLYTDEGQPLLRVFWIVTILTLPYVLIVVAILG